MKISDIRKNKLTRAQLRQIERDLGIFLDLPQNVYRTTKQQFAVYDEEEHFVSDIMSDKENFSEEELRQTILALFNK